MSGPRMSEAGIIAEIPYLRSDLDHLHVDYSARTLGDDVIERRPMLIHDGRAAGRELSLDREGLTIASWPVPSVRERLDELTAEATGPDPLRASDAHLAYLRETLPLIERLSGAREVLISQGTTVRYSAAARRVHAMTPAGWPHLDYDAGEARVQLDVAIADNRADPAPFSRFVLYQGWRVLSDPPQDFPLALCDGRTVRDDDMVPIDYRLRSETRDTVYRTCGSRFSERHHWWYFPNMTKDEMIVFNGFDSANAASMKTLHVAFEDPTVADPIPRASIETRYFALYD